MVLLKQGQCVPVSTWIFVSYTCILVYISVAIFLPFFFLFFETALFSFSPTRLRGVDEGYVQHLHFFGWLALLASFGIFGLFW